MSSQYAPNRLAIFTLPNCYGIFFGVTGLIGGATEFVFFSWHLVQIFIFVTFRLTFESKEKAFILLTLHVCHSSELILITVESANNMNMLGLNEIDTSSKRKCFYILELLHCTEFYTTLRFHCAGGRMGSAIVSKNEYDHND